MNVEKRIRRPSAAIAALFLLWATCLAVTGCGMASTPPSPHGSVSAKYSFRTISTSLEVKKAVADPRGVLWLLDFSGCMHTLDPDLYLAPLPEAGEGIFDFWPHLPEEGGETGMPAGVYLACGDRGLRRLAGDGILQQVMDEAGVLTVGEEGQNRLWVGTAEGCFELSAQKKDGPFAGGKGVVISLVTGPQGERLGLLWENRVFLLDGVDPGGRELSVPGELSVRVVALVDGAGAGPMLVSTQAIYRLEGGGLVEVDRFDDPVTSACGYREGEILLGRSSGRITIWREGGPEEELADLDKGVDRLSCSKAGFIYAVCGREIHLGEPPSTGGEPVSRTFSLKLRLDQGDAGPVSLKLPESASLDPLWYYFKVLTGSEEPSWELVELPGGGHGLRLEDEGKKIGVEALVTAESLFAWRYQPGDVLTFPARFPEEAERFLEKGPGLPWDLEGLRGTADQLPQELREDMLSVLVFLVKRSGLFYRAPASSAAYLPPEPGTGWAEEYARDSVLRALRGEGGDDYGRSLLLVMLCRELGIPARQALCLDRFLAQVYLNGVGWVAVDVSFPVYAIESGSYPAIGSLPGKMESFITATGGSGDDLRFARFPEGGEGEAAIAGSGEGKGFAAALVICKPASGISPAEEYSLKLPEGGWYYFVQETAGVRFMRQGPRRWDVLVTGDERTFPLGPQTAARLFLAGDHVVLLGPPSL